VRAKGYVPSHSGTLVYFGVPDIEAVLKRIKQNGAKVLLPKTSIGEYGFIAHFEDSGATGKLYIAQWVQQYR
jgi:predicted enzyme related to lactoylglutathione lyase